MLVPTPYFGTKTGQNSQERKKERTLFLSFFQVSFSRIRKHLRRSIDHFPRKKKGWWKKASFSQMSLCSPRWVSEWVTEQRRKLITSKLSGYSGESKKDIDRERENPMRPWLKTHTKQKHRTGSFSKNAEWKHWTNFLTYQLGVKRTPTKARARIIGYIKVDILSQFLEQLHVFLLFYLRGWY